MRDILLSFIKIHILFHAGQAPVYGAWLLEELARHGYRLSPGTLYPTLHALEEAGYLERSEEVVEGKVRKYYRLTTAGRAALDEIGRKMQELAGEILANPLSPGRPPGSPAPSV
ncbi:MAG: PadR family transcriptional regulator [Bacillota bacterium]|nr:PadR family transcriptional regulator [Bacillota bacterium]